MKVSELYDLLDAFKVAGYGGCDIYLRYESGSEVEIDTITLEISTNAIFIGE